MMILITVFLSIIQGITEFLPISSSAHLMLLPWIFKFQDPGLAFDAAIHIGTAMALVVVFYKDFWKLIKTKSPLLWYILIASVPAAVAGFLGDKFIDEHLHQASYAPLIVGIGLIFFSFVLYFIDKHAKLNEGIEKLDAKQSLLIGFAQVLALVPGTSRSGITIAAGEWLGLKREDAARFSFLLATPISLGAGVYKLLGLLSDKAGGVSIPLTILGIVVSFITGVLVIKWFLGFLRRHSLMAFIVYRVAFGALVIVLWLFRR